MSWKLEECKALACGQLLPVRTRICVRCRAPVKPDDVSFKGVRIKSQAGLATSFTDSPALAS